MSIIPGTAVIQNELNAIGSIERSDTFNPPTAVEYGRAVSPNSKAKTNDADGKLPYAA